MQAEKQDLPLRKRSGVAGGAGKNRGYVHTAIRGAVPLEASVKSPDRFYI